MKGGQSRRFRHRRRNAIEAPEQEGTRQKHGGAEVECRGGAAGPFGAGAADDRSEHHRNIVDARPPISIRVNAPSTVVLSPNLCPVAPPGNASATPGVKYRPIRIPISASPTPKSCPSSGATAATL